MHPRFQRRLRPIAAFILVFFSWFCIEPWNYAVAAPPPNAAPKEKGASEKLEEALHAVKSLTQGLDQELAADREIQPKVDQLIQHQKNIAALDSAVQKEFADTEAFLKARNLPSVIRDRHAKALADYKNNIQALRANLDDLVRIQGEWKQAKGRGDLKGADQKKSELRAELKVARTHLEEKVKERPHAPHKPSKPAVRSRELKPVRTSLLNRISEFFVSSVYAAEPPPPDPADLAGTLEAPISSEISELATELGGTPVALYEYVRNHFKYEPYAGSVKGAIQTLREGAGNEWDLASLLIALYRASGIPARYVVGTVEIPIDRAMSWLGVEDPNMAGSLLLSAGRPTSVGISGGKIVSLRTQHVWVQAYVPFIGSRGATSGPGDTWVVVDPSFKTQTVNQTLNVNSIPTFDQISYLSTLRMDSPFDFYRNQLQAYLDINVPGYVPEALSRNLETDREQFGILIGQAPYNIRSITESYTEVPDSARQKFTLTLAEPLTGESDVIYTITLPQIIGKRLTISYVPATASDEATVSSYGGLYSTPPYLISVKPVVKVEGAIVAQGNAIGAGKTQRLEFFFDNTFSQEQVENIVVAGEYYAIALNSQSGITHEDILDRGGRLRTINAKIDLNDPTTLDDRLGELFHLSAMVYHQNIDAAVRKMAPLHKVVDIRDVSEIMYFLTLKIDTVFGVPKKMTPAGIIADMDRNTHLVIPVDGDLGRIKPFMQLIGNQTSYLEHAVTEKIYHAEALSAVKGIQLAHDQGISVHTVTNQNISSILPLLQVSTGVKEDITNAVNAGQEVIVPEQNPIVGDWKGVGYIIQDPVGGAGAYQISGGFGGAVIVNSAAMVDILNAVLSEEFPDRAYSTSDIPKICYPGADNVLNYTDPNVPDSQNVCYTMVPLNLIADEIGAEEDSNGVVRPILGPCLEGKRAERGIDGKTLCQRKYSFRTKLGVVAPLIRIDENPLDAHLTKNIRANHFRSQDGGKSQYMRAGLGVLLFTEVLMQVFKYAPERHGINDPQGSGYRTPKRNAEVGGRPQSYHMSGTAADIVFELSRLNLPSNATPPDKCAMLRYADRLMDRSGGVLDEGRTVTVHFSIPTHEGRDYDKSGWKGTNCTPP